jgi:hypothetical protein
LVLCLILLARFSKLSLSALCDVNSKETVNKQGAIDAAMWGLRFSICFTFNRTFHELSRNFLLDALVHRSSCISAELRWFSVKVFMVESALKLLQVGALLNCRQLGSASE